MRQMTMMRCGLMAAVLAFAPLIALAQGAGAGAGQEMTMVTFNLHHDRENWPARRQVILRELQTLQPDAIALQEVIQKPHVRNQAAWLARKLGYE
ncbi:hypothetical protein ACTGZP_11560, partial [Streptococcus suis]